MPNIRSQEITSDGITIVASDGRSFSITREQVMDIWRDQRGNPAARFAATKIIVIQMIEAALGPEQVPQSLIDFDFDDVRGMKRVSTGSGPEAES